jgi:aminomethyltransferase
MPLYGHELDDATTPLDAGLAAYLKLDRGGFVGAEALHAAAAAGPTRRLVGFELEERGIARAEYPVEKNGVRIGRVTSGAPSPTLGKSIGLAYVPLDLSAPGARFDVVIRGRATPARVVETPFVRGGAAS